MGQGDGARREDGLFRGCRPGRAASGGGVPGRQLEKQHHRLSSCPWVSGQSLEPVTRPLAGVGSDRKGGQMEDPALEEIKTVWVCLFFQ